MLIFSLSPERAITVKREPSKKKQRTDTKKDAKSIKNDNFTRSNRENEWLNGTIIISYFGGNKKKSSTVHISIKLFQDHGFS